MLPVFISLRFKMWCSLCTYIGWHKGRADKNACSHQWTWYDMNWHEPHNSYHLNVCIYSYRCKFIILTTISMCLYVTLHEYTGLMCTKYISLHYFTYLARSQSFVVAPVLITTHTNQILHYQTTQETLFMMWVGSIHTPQCHVTCVVVYIICIKLCMQLLQFWMLTIFTAIDTWQSTGTLHHVHNRFNTCGVNVMVCDIISRWVLTLSTILFDRTSTSSNSHIIRLPHA